MNRAVTFRRHPVPAQRWGGQLDSLSEKCWPELKTDILLRPIAASLVQTLAGLAEFERELIRARTSKGRARAKARGVKLGRKFKLQQRRVKERR